MMIVRSAVHTQKSTWPVIIEPKMMIMPNFPQYYNNNNGENGDGGRLVCFDDDDDQENVAWFCVPTYVAIIAGVPAELVV